MAEHGRYIFFGILTRQDIRRSTFTDVTDLEIAIRTYIDSSSRVGEVDHYYEVGPQQDSCDGG